MRIGFIGAGKVGFTLGRYITEHGRRSDADFDSRFSAVCVLGYYSLHPESARAAALFTDTCAYESLETLVSESDVIIITVPDGQIEAVWNSIKELDISSKLICHCSGAMTSKIFSGVAQAGAYAYSIHPIYAINSRETSYKTLNEAVFTVEGDELYAEKVRDYIRYLGNECIIISAENKVKYHCSAVFASNLVTGLYRMSCDMLRECDFPDDLAEKALLPLFMGNASHIAAQGISDALTGPVERNDAATVEKHLKEISGSYRQVYLMLTDKLLDIAQEKYPDRDYDRIRELVRKYRFIGE